MKHAVLAEPENLSLLSSIFYPNDRIGKSTDTESFFAGAVVYRWKIENPNLHFVRISKEQKDISDVEQWDLPKTRDKGTHRVRSGTLKEWREGISEPCAKSAFLVFALGIAAAGPLFEMIGGAEPAVYHFQGAPKQPGADNEKKSKSTSGKTMSACLAASTVGRCRPQDLFSFDITERGLEEICFGNNNLFVVLDEEGRAGEGGASKKINPKVLPYLVISGRGKQRSKIAASNHNLQNLTWLLPVISTGEEPLDAPGRGVRKEGAEVRMVPIPIPPTWQGGIFNRLNDATANNATERNRLAEMLKKTIAKNYGVAMPVYLKRLMVHRTELITEIPKMVDAFVGEVGADGDAWERRFAAKFAIVAVGAALLARYGIAPWTEERALKAVTYVYKRSRGSLVSVPKATDALLARLRKSVAAKKRFIRLPKGQSLNVHQKKQVWGVIRDIDGKKRVTAVPFTRLKKLVQPSAVADQVLRELSTRGLLVKAADGGLTRQLLIKGFAAKERCRYVCITGLMPQAFG